MSIFVKSGGWRRASGPFWEAKEPVLEVPPTYQMTLKDRGRSPQVVGVYNPATSDYRIKVFADVKQGVSADSKFQIHIDGRPLGFAGSPNGPLVAKPESATLWRILQGLPVPTIDEQQDEESEDPFVPSYLDVSVEASFTGERIWRHHWEGDITRSPKWMDVRRIGITPPETTGGAHGLLLEVGCELRHLPHSVRVNGHWCRWMPLSTTTLILNADPLDIAAIREGEPGEPETVPVPAYDRNTIHKLYHAVKFPAADCRTWARAAETMRNKHLGMCTFIGQQDYYRRVIRRLENEKIRKQGYLAARFRRRADAYQNHAIDEWAEEVRGKPLEWLNRIDAIEQTYLPRCKARYEDFGISIAEMRHEADAAEAQIDEFSEPYEDAIRFLYPPR